MNSGIYVFKQVTSFLPKYEFDKLVLKYNGHYKVKTFTCWSQFLCLFFGQITQRESLRGIVICLQSQSAKLYHLGIQKGVTKSTLADANKNRDWRIYADFAQLLINQARPLYEDDPEFKIDLQNSIYALDSSTIDLCLSVFPWTPSTKGRAAVKLHTLMDLRGSIPVWIRFSNGLTHDMNLLSKIHFEEKSFYIMDRGYLKLEELFRINSSKAFFVIRAKKDLNFRRLYSNSKSKSELIIYDQIGHFKTFYSNKKYPEKIRRIKSRDLETGKIIVILTNNFDVGAQTIAQLYRSRWQIELFFKWIKQHLRIIKFWGHSSNAVKTHIWVAIATYVLISIVKKKLNSDLTIYEILQILSVSVFDKTPINQLLMNQELHDSSNNNPNQLKINL